MSTKITAFKFTPAELDELILQLYIASKTLNSDFPPESWELHDIGATIYDALQFLQTRREITNGENLSRIY